MDRLLLHEREYPEAHAVLKSLTKEELMVLLLEERERHGEYMRKQIALNNDVYQGLINLASKVKHS